MNMSGYTAKAVGKCKSTNKRPGENSSAASLLPRWAREIGSQTKPVSSPRDLRNLVGLTAYRTMTCRRSYPHRNFYWIFHLISTRRATSVLISQG